MINNSSKRIIIYSGTTEGRELSLILSDDGILHTVCVATEYGRSMQKENAYASVHEGRLNADEMLSLYSPETEYIIDATHPYADEVTSNIKKSVELFNSENKKKRFLYPCPQGKGFGNRKSEVFQKYKGMCKSTG